MKIACHIKANTIKAYLFNGQGGGHALSLIRIGMYL